MARVLKTFEVLLVVKGTTVFILIVIFLDQILRIPI
jgi:hypothetical protein